MTNGNNQKNKLCSHCKGNRVVYKIIDPSKPYKLEICSRCNGTGFSLTSN